MNDKKLLKLIAKDPQEGLNEAINAYSGLLTSVVLRILKDEREAEECVADTFIALWKNLANIKKAESLKGYLLCIARNNAINRYHKQIKQSTVSTDGVDGFEFVSDDDVELLIIKNEFMEELQNMILKLPQPNRDIFMRKYFLFESVSEIAEKTGLNNVQVKDRLYRSRKQIRKDCEKKGVNYNEIIFTTARPTEQRLG